METQIIEQPKLAVQKTTKSSSSSVGSFSSQSEQSAQELGLKAFGSADQTEKHQAQVEWNGIKNIINKKKKPKRVGSMMFNMTKEDSISTQSKELDEKISHKILDKIDRPVMRANSSKNMELMNKLKHSSNSLLSSVDQSSNVDSHQFQNIKAIKVAKLQAPCQTAGFNLGDVPFANNDNWEDSSAGSDFDQINRFGSSKNLDKLGSSKMVIPGSGSKIPGSGSSKNVSNDPSSKSKKEESKLRNVEMSSDSMSEDSVSQNSSEDDNVIPNKQPKGYNSSQASLSKESSFTSGKPKYSPAKLGEQNSSEKEEEKTGEKTDKDITLQAKKVINFNINKKTQLKYGMSSTNMMEQIQEASTPSAEISTPSQNIVDAQGNPVNALMIKSKFCSVTIQKDDK